MNPTKKIFIRTTSLFWKLLRILIIVFLLCFSFLVYVVMMPFFRCAVNAWWSRLTYPSINSLTQNYENKKNIFELIAQEAIRDCEEYGLREFYSEPQWGKRAFFWEDGKPLPSQRFFSYYQALFYLDIDEIFIYKDCKSVSFTAATKYDNYNYQRENHYEYTREYLYSTEIPESECSTSFKGITSVSEEYGLIPDLNKFEPDCDKNYYLYQRLDRDWYLRDGRFWHMIRIP